jgi:hypothetical protein
MLLSHNWFTGAEISTTVWNTTRTLHLFQVVRVRYLGGSDGAITLAKYSWFAWFPRITSATVLMVSVRMSAGTPLAIRMLQSVSSNPHAFIVFCDDDVTWAGFPGITNILTTCNTKGSFVTNGCETKWQVLRIQRILSAGPADVHLHFRGTSDNFYQTTWHHNPEDSALQNRLLQKNNETFQLCYALSGVGK